MRSHLHPTLQPVNGIFRPISRGSKSITEAIIGSRHFRIISSSLSLSTKRMALFKLPYILRVDDKILQPFSDVEWYSLEEVKRFQRYIYEYLWRYRKKNNGIRIQEIWHILVYFMNKKKKIFIRNLTRLLLKINENSFFNETLYAYVEYNDLYAYNIKFYWKKTLQMQY